MMGKEKYASGDIRRDQFYRYIENLVSENERKKIESELNENPGALDELATLAKIGFEPLSETEKEDFKTLYSRPKEKEIQEFVDYAKAEASGHKEKKLTLEKLGQTIRSVWQKIKDFFGPAPILRPILAAVVLFALIGTGYLSMLAYDSWQDKRFFAAFVYDEKPPIEYTGTTLRGTSEAFDQDPLVRRLETQFRFAMGAYVGLEYQRTIVVLNSMKSDVEVLLQRATAPESVQFLREYYLYLGVSQFAVSRNQKSDLSENERIAYAEDAIASLSEAKTFADANNLAGKDREEYFLGLAYGFAGRRDLAVQTLETISSESRFYSESEILIDKWSE